MDNLDFDLTTSAGVRGAITTLYVATLGRAPDADGLDFWEGQFTGAAGDTTDEAALDAVLYNIAESFRLTAEADAASDYSADASAVLSATSSEDVTDAQVEALANEVIANAFGANASANGADFVDSIKADLDSEDGASIGQALTEMVNTIIEGGGTDETVLSNRVAAADAFVEATPANAVESSVVSQANTLNDSVDENTADAASEGTTAAGSVLGSTDVSASETGPFDATTGAVQFNIQSGSYTAEIQDFESGDVFNAFEGASVTVLTDSDQTDGEQQIQFANNDTGATAIITLTGLTEDQDSGVFKADAIDSTFGDGSLIFGGDSGDSGDASGGDGSGDTSGGSGSGGESGGSGSGSGGVDSTEIVDASNTGPFDATTGNVEFDISAGSFSATIDGFDSGDVLDVFEGAGPTVLTDSDQTDGEQQIQFANNDTGATAIITLTGLTEAQDSGVFKADAIDSTFGDGTLI